MKASVLLVDDDPSIRRALVDRIRFWGHDAEEASDGELALEAASKHAFDVVFLDLSMPGRGGMDVLREWKSKGYDADVIVLTAQGSIESAVEAIRAGAADFLLKPADFALLQAALDRVLSRRRLERVNQALTEQMGAESSGAIAGASVMKELMDTAARAAQGSATVLLTGESGSGKQVVAEFIHRQSPRQKGPFLYVNCVAIPRELMESTLFGHEAGAFTGAMKRRIGRLEAADGGTAFLDEIGDISAELQAKLLHFLDSGEIERVGGERPIRVDCRVITATNRDLEAAVRDKTFREDLYYRLNVVRLRIPPLRERTGDVALLATSFLNQFSARRGRGKLQFASRTMEILEKYSWPGNIRQLRNAVERMVALAETDTLTPALLPPEVLSSDLSSEGDPDGLPLKEATLEFRKRYIAKTLAQTGGNQTAAAKILGIQRPNLNREIKQLGL
jgi:two-component system, NtrC family, response regulator HydG